VGVAIGGGRKEGGGELRGDFNRTLEEMRFSFCTLCCGGVHRNKNHISEGF